MRHACFRIDPSSATARTMAPLYRPIQRANVSNAAGWFGGLLEESQGVLFRASSGSEMRTQISVEDGQPKGRAMFKDAATGNVYFINHDRQTARVMRQLPLPLLPSPFRVPPESETLGKRVINGVECVGKPIFVNGQLAPGASWYSEACSFSSNQTSPFLVEPVESWNSLTSGRGNRMRQSLRIRRTTQSSIRVLSNERLRRHS